MGFTGQWFDLATGLQYNHHRWYDPAAGRWLSEDPIGFAGGDGNLYRYVGNQVNTYLDPSGWRKSHAQILEDQGYTITRPPSSSILAAFDPVALWYELNGYRRQQFGNVWYWQKSNGPSPIQRWADDANSIPFNPVPADVIRLAAEGDARRLASEAAKGALMKRATKLLESGTKLGASAFPSKFDDLLPELPRDAKGRIYPSDFIRIRPEQHPLQPGELFSPRHHGPHFHVEIRRDSCKSWNNPNNVIKVKPPDYKPGEGTGFLPGEPYPGS
jgi:RHS repeat-associated protein